MKAVILAGGLGTRIAEESDTKPKPMVDIGGHPLLWHIMKTYAHHGINDFIICLGYKGYVIKEFFFNYHHHLADMRINLGTGEHQILNSQSEDWNIVLIDTGPDTLTGGRLKRVAKYLGDETFCLTYGDGLSDIDITAEIAFHKRHGKLATVAAVQPPGRFGVLNLNSDHHVTSFEEKPSDEIGWINGGFFILEPSVINYIEGDATSWERAPLVNLARDNQLAAFLHSGFWQPCDTLRDKRELEYLWRQGNAPWQVWNS
ncbi:glucose-1-phosphate cytidylyltransferase [Pectobacteriaceae bacterium CE70]|uniref:Glucose-1-phosphate cytidylyltransferase n=1 Tax=Serratia sp. (strain ATCC 39006) TaxID=104623 RepID=A0A2I5TC70_SERS3|nr:MULTISPECIES: glucose-1-phosphate cytidylyltransferase [Enterobacterales]WJV63235.1 glucose-1-phosphate cytidylyltransferase [Pectobacteriaceae bacterium C52]WJV67604.1 glucose-1-phosphate cytidylyltransferase [Pectobacteriaceae bacterium CE70]WJY11545.1 glucose-1-phosphate cytidylyltransferase [Pectobacteriaceae bacterium C80]AUH02159.1 glucose-1-phosphate cytidylyltransferase [Serratia sp. ATCC 39006]AUH06480.1 glucose-1-phosphate cytidylyltransferase [Serratia sp. ATCC 39006]